MPAPTTTDELLQLIRKSGLVDEKRLDNYLEKFQAAGISAPDTAKLAGFLVRDGVLTQFQVEQLLLGKWRRFHIGKYKVLERIGSGGMGSVYLCEHRLMRRRVAVKVLPTAKSEDSSAKERFQREARAIAALDHPNLVRAYDIDQDDQLHFLVMEYVDGSNLQEIIKRTGPLEVHRCAHYMAQAALALQHAHEVAGIVHRDIKPGNILVDRNGVVKVLDMGLARFFHDEEDLLTQKYDENVLGTADYLAPEQALDSHSVDIKADIYSLGATLYFCLTGKAPFAEGTVAQKLIWHQTRQPKPIRALRPDVPEELCAIVDKMMAKDPAQRFQLPLEVTQALTPWTQAPIPPPPEAEMPKLSLAAMGGAIAEPSTVGASSVPTSGPGSRARKVWQVPGSPKPQPQSPPPQTPRPPMAVAPATPPPAAPPEVPLPANGVVAAPPAPTPAAPAEAEPVPWESLAADTQEAFNQLDTVPNRSRSPRPSSKRLANAQGPPVPIYLRYLWWGVGGAVLLFILVVILLVRTLSNRSSQGTGPGPAGPSSPFLRVQRGGHGQPNTFDTLREALLRAKHQDRIKIFDEVIEEQIALVDPRLAKDVLIESGVEGKPFLWRSPSQAKEDEPLLKIGNIEGLRVRGFVMDGQGRVKDLVTLSGVCPGVALAEGQLRGFTVRAITVMNCEGQSDKPVRLERLKITRSKPQEVGIFFDARSNVRQGANLHIRVQDCVVEGGGTSDLIQITSPKVLRDVEFVNSPKPEEAKPGKSNPKK